MLIAVLIFRFKGIGMSTIHAARSHNLKVSEVIRQAMSVGRNWMKDLTAFGGLSFQLSLHLKI